MSCSDIIILYYQNTHPKNSNQEGILVIQHPRNQYKSRQAHLCQLQLQKTPRSNTHKKKECNRKTSFLAGISSSGDQSFRFPTAQITLSLSLSLFRTQSLYFQIPSQKPCACVFKTNLSPKLQSETQVAWTSKASWGRQEAEV